MVWIHNGHRPPAARLLVARRRRCDWPAFGGESRARLHSHRMGVKLRAPPCDALPIDPVRSPLRPARSFPLSSPGPANSGGAIKVV